MHIDLTPQQKAIEQAIQDVGLSGALTAHMNLFIDELGAIIRGRLVSGAFSNVQIARFQLNPKARNEWLISSPQASHPRIRARLETIVRAIDPFNPGSANPVSEPYSVDGQLIGEYIQKHVQWLKANVDIALARDFKVTFEDRGKTQTAEIGFLAVEKKSLVADLYIRINTPTDDSHQWCENESFIQGVFNELNRVHGTSIKPFGRAEYGMQSNDTVCLEPSKKDNADFIRLVESLGFIDESKIKEQQEIDEGLQTDYPSN